MNFEYFKIELTMAHVSCVISSEDLVKVTYLSGPFEVSYEGNVFGFINNPFNTKGAILHLISEEEDTFEFIPIKDIVNLKFINKSVDDYENI